MDEKELNELLTRPILNQGDSEYAQSISLLEAGSWFKRGLALLAHSEPKCPFCQCTLDEDLIGQIRHAFSDDYTEKNAALESQSEMIRNDIEALGRILVGRSAIDVLDTSPLETSVLTLRDHLREVLRQVEIKKDSPGAALDPISVGSLKDTVFTELYELNQSIVSLNNDAANHQKLEKGLVSAAMPALLAETWSEIEPHLKEHENILKAEQGIRIQLSAIEADIQALKVTIDEEGRKVRDSKVHLTNINSLIDYMVGDAFRLEETDEGGEPSNYRVVRHDGSPVGKFLSEGEEQLLAFLYFISEIWNVGEDGTDVEESRATVIIDDPMSSLDSDLLFGVSSLIVDLIDGMGVGRYHIEQLTCLSHNATFYNNLTYRFKQSDNRFQHFMIRKKDFGYNEVVAVLSSPVTSVYANLWKSIKRAESAHEPYNVALANTMRRILENYFSAGNSLSRLTDIKGFKRTDQVVINSLVSWANAGSHNLMDSLEVGLPDIGVQTYLRVFRTIFTETGHGAHYDMMMAQETVQQIGALSE